MEKGKWFCFGAHELFRPAFREKGGITFFFPFGPQALFTVQFVVVALFQRLLNSSDVWFLKLMNDDKVLLQEHQKWCVAPPLMSIIKTVILRWETLNRDQFIIGYLSVINLLVPVHQGTNRVATALSFNSSKTKHSILNSPRNSLFFLPLII